MNLNSDDKRAPIRKLDENAQKQMLSSYYKRTKTAVNPQTGEVVRLTGVYVKQCIAMYSNV